MLLIFSFSFFFFAGREHQLGLLRGWISFQVTDKEKWDKSSRKGRRQLYG